MMQKWSLWVLISVTLWGITGCDLFNPAEPLPVYLQLNVPTVIDPLTGANENLGIRDFWIDHNGVQLGIFRLPTTIPLIPGEDQNQITIRGGIFENGLSTLRSPYIFWQPVTLDLEPVPLDTIPIDVQVDYWPVDSIVDYRFIEDFEGASFGFVESYVGANATSMSIRSSGAYKGNGSGYVPFTESGYRFEASANEAFRLPQSNNNDIYMEMTFRCNVPFTVGLAYAGVFTQTSGLLPVGVTFNSRMEWRTVYLHIGELVRSIPDDAIFTPYLQASTYDQANDIGIPGELWLDNIRIVQFVE